MFELMAIVGLFFILGAFAVVMLKVVLALLILPIKIAFWMARGFLAFVIAIPLAVIFLNVFSIAFPLLVFLVFLPFLVGITALALLLKHVL